MLGRLKVARAPPAVATPTGSTVRRSRWGNRRPTLNHADATTLSTRMRGEGDIWKAPPPEAPAVVWPGAQVVWAITTPFAGRKARHRRVPPIRPAGATLAAKRWKRVSLSKGCWRHVGRPAKRCTPQAVPACRPPQQVPRAGRYAELRQVAAGQLWGAGGDGTRAVDYENQVLVQESTDFQSNEVGTDTLGLHVELLMRISSRARRAFYRKGAKRRFRQALQAQAAVAFDRELKEHAAAVEAHVACEARAARASERARNRPGRPWARHLASELAAGPQLAPAGEPGEVAAEACPDELHNTSVCRPGSMATPHPPHHRGKPGYAETPPRPHLPSEAAREMQRALMAETLPDNVSSLRPHSAAQDSRNITRRTLFEVVSSRPSPTHSPRDARYAYRGSRVGEATNPGPPREAPPAAASDRDDGDEEGAFADYTSNPVESRGQQRISATSGALPGAGSGAAHASADDDAAAPPSDGAPLFDGFLQHASGENAPVPVPSGFHTPPEELEAAGIELHHDQDNEAGHYDFSNLFRRDATMHRGSATATGCEDPSNASECMICLAPIADDRVEWPGCRHAAHAECVVRYLRGRCEERGADWGDALAPPAHMVARISCPFRGNVLASGMGLGVEACFQRWATAADGGAEADTALHNAAALAEAGGLTTEALRDERARARARDAATHRSPEAAPPAPPPQLQPLCCHRVAPPDFVQIQDRRMTWSPDAVHEHNLEGGARRIVAWRDNWLCYACSATVQRTEARQPEGTQYCGRCGRDGVWIWDRRTSNGEWRCTHCDQDAWVNPVRPDIPSLGTGPATTHQTNPVHQPNWPGAWGPPQAPVQNPQNSWLYVPILLYAADWLSPQMARAWGEHPLSTQWWPAAANRLRAAAPVDRDDLVIAMVGVFQNPAPGVAEAAARIQEALAPGPAPLLQVVRAVAAAHGYVAAPVQDLLLQIYAQDVARELDARADTFRQMPQHRSGPQQTTANRAASERGHAAHATAAGAAAEGCPANRRQEQEEGASTAHGGHNPYVERPRTGVNPGSDGDDGPSCEDNDVDMEAADNAAAPQAPLVSSEGTSEAAGPLDTQSHRRRRRTFRTAPRAGRPPTDPQCPYPTQQAERASRPAPSTDGMMLSACSLQLMDEVDMQAELEVHVPTVRDPPRFLRSAVRSAYTSVLFTLQDAHRTGDHARVTQCWKLFILTSRMLLARPQQHGAAGKELFTARVTAWQRGDWISLLRDAHAAQGRRPRLPRTAAEEEAARFEQACAQVQLGTPSRARHTLTASPVAPGSPDTLRQLTDQERRPQALQRPLPCETHTFVPPEALRLDVVRFLGALRSARRGSAPGPSGTRAEHLKPLLENEQAMELLGFAASQLAAAAVPAEIAEAFGLCRMTALRKPDGGVRGIATGDVFRRLVTRTLAQQFAAELVTATSPYQYALSTRAGTDCAAFLLRTAAETDEHGAIVSLDGVGAYDHVSRAAIFDALLANPALAPLVPFVRLWYGDTASYLWTDDTGRVHRIHQGEGVEQGDALAPALFALGLHGALREASARLDGDEMLVAFLDDVYVKTDRRRARRAFDLVTDCIQRHANIRTNLGKCRVYSTAGGPAPPGIAELGADVWRGDRPAEERGVKILGTPVGTPEYVRAHARARMEDERRLLDQLPRLPDTQCAWLLLRYCASPRANHLLRTVPPEQLEPYAADHDAAMWEALRGILGGGDLEASQEQVARALAFLPGRSGGLGLQAATRISPAAYWAAWADALPLLHARWPQVTAQVLATLRAAQEPAQPSLLALRRAANLLVQEGFQGPSWEDLLAGATPPPIRRTDNTEEEAETPEPAELAHGWQFAASSARHRHFRATQLMPALPASTRALVRSASGPRAAEWLTALPTGPGFRLTSSRCQVALRRRIRLPLPLLHRCCGGDGTPGCQGILDSVGDHLAACPRTGFLARRAGPVERTWTRVAREAGGRVAHKQLLRDTNVGRVSPEDRRQLDLVVYGVTRNGTALCCDATVVSPLTRSGAPHGRAASHDGAALRVAERRKRRTYPELANSNMARLVVLACEIGGRWNGEALRFVRQLADQRAAAAPVLLRGSARQAWANRWWGLLSIAVQDALAATLCREGHLALGGPTANEDIPLADVLLAAAPATAPSRLPFRG